MAPSSEAVALLELREWFLPNSRDDVDVRTARCKHSLGVFSHLSNPFRGIFVRRKVQVRHLGHCMPNGFVDGPSHLATLNVGDGVVHVGSGHRHGERLEAVHRDQRDVGVLVAKDVGHRFDQLGARFDHSVRGVVLGENRDPIVDREAVALYLINGVSKPLGEMRSAGDDAEVEIGSPLESPRGPSEREGSRREWP